MAQGSSNPTTNLNRINGTTVAVNSGAADAGTQRVILATNQPVIPISDNGGSLTVDGTVAVSGSVAVTGPLTDTQLRATAVPVSGTVTVGNASIPVTDNGGSLTVDAPVGTPAFVRLSNGTAAVDTIPVSGTFWQATQPVSGTVTATGPLTNTELRATAVPVSGTFWQATQPVSGTVAATQSGVWNITNISGTVSLPTGAATAANQATEITALQLLDDAVGTTGTAVTSGMYRIGGTDGTNSRMLSVTTAGAVNIADGGNSITVDSPVAAPTFVRLSNGTTAVDTIPVSGTFWQATQPVSGSVTVSGTVTATGPLTNTELRATAVPVSGTVAATQSGTWTVQPGNTANTTPWLTRLSDGTNAAAIKAASTAAIATDPALVVSVSPNNAVTVSQAVAANLNATVTGTVELGATSLAALENISVTIPGTVDLGTVSLTALETITVTQSTASNFLNKPFGSVTTAAPTYTTGTDNALSLTTNGGLRTSIIDALPAGTNAIGKLAANDGVDIGDVTINNPSIAVTGTFWQTTQPVSGTVAATQSGTWNVTNISGTVSLPTGAATAANQATEITSLQLLDDAVGTTGTAVTSGMYRVGGTDGTNSRMLSVNTSGHVNIADGGNSITVDSPVGTPTFVRLSNGTSAVDTIPVSGTFWQATQPVSNAGTFAVQVSSALPTGANTIGAVNVNGTVPVSGTFWQATQPVSLASLPSLPAGTNNIGDVDVLSLPSIPAGNNNIGDVDIASLPGTVAADISATKVGVELLDNTVLAASTLPTTTNQSLVVSLGPNSKAYDQADDMLKVKSVQKKFRDSFNGAALDTAKWDSSVGTGGSITVSGGTVTIASGTTIASETSITTKEVFTIPFRVSAQLTLSQRIANQSFIIEAISVNASTGVPDGLNTIAWVFDGTVATNAIYRVANGGGTPLNSAASTITTTATTGGVYELEPFADEAWFHSTILDSTAGRAVSYRRHQQIPDPNAVYKIRCRWLNGGVAPATSTNAVMQFVACQDYAELTAEITAGRGNAAVGQAIATQVLNTVTVAAHNVYNTPIFSSTTYQPTNATTTAYANSLVIKAAAGALYAITGFNSKTTPQYIQVHNTTTVPADTAVPVIIFYVPAMSNFSLDLNPYGRYFATGITVCNSSTGPTKTIGAADCWFDVQYR